MLYKLIEVKKMAEVIAVANQKGGVGKTMTSVSLSACLALHKKKVLLIDLDPQGHSTKAFGYRNMNEYPLSMKDVIISVIKSTIDAGYIKIYDETASMKMRRYKPYWA